MLSLFSRIGKLLITILVVGSCALISGEGVFAATSTVPVPVNVAGGDGHGIAAWSDGTVTGWGYNKYGQVGDGTSIHQFVPKRIDGLANIVQVAAARDISFALSKDGEVWAWGDGYSPYVSGDVVLQYQKRGLPVKMDGLEQVSNIDTNGFAGVAVHNDGTATLWYPTHDPTDPMTVTTKYVSLKGVSNASSAVILDYTVLILDCDGKVSSLSIYNTVYGRYRSENELPAVQPIRSSISTIVSSGRDAFLLNKNGTVSLWNEESKKTATISGFTGISNIQTGYKRLYALNSNGSIWQWNYNAGTKAKPFQVKSLSNIADIWGSTGQFGYALRKDGKLMAWGDGYYTGMATGSGSPTIDKGKETAYAVNVQTPLSWTVKGQSISFYGTSGIINGKLYVPFTSVFEALGVKISSKSELDPKQNGRSTSIKTFAYEDKTLVIKGGSPAEVLLNGKNTGQTVNIQVMSNTTMYPLETICEQLGISLQWNKTTGEVVLGGA
ncbi:stalk domain-containing protein [Paenibacillus segetis]|uniref:Copper amine oxidase-like N-terminal domain-containing protein n=1 Tax=Paenibacillus segetis TaxID=1325360 RepID=A0ABQ1YEX5_9BACL|nr:stalk domain-containing protein [Paenibacillus segetis]GGH23613.1 hypothetical protein GCM10008013_22860 [Paenibacillus segetis]